MAGLDAPAANVYDAGVSALLQRGGRITDTTIPRFHSRPSVTPPPNMYTLGPEYGHSVYKRTFNVTLNPTEHVQRRQTAPSTSTNP